MSAPIFCPPPDGFDKVAVRLLLLPITIYWGDFLGHVETLASKHAEGAPFLPSYYAAHIAPTMRDGEGGPIFPLLAPTVSRMVNALETAAACCIWAGLVDPTYREGLLNDAESHCLEFDTIRAEPGYQSLLKAEARWRGGKAAQLRRECGRIRGARLILVMRPPQGWESPAHAARTIEKRLALFIHARRLPIVCEGSFRRTIVRWIHNHPAAQAAYAASCR